MAVPVMTADRSNPNGTEMDIPVAPSSPLPKLGESIENKFHRAVTKNTPYYDGFRREAFINST